MSKDLKPLFIFINEKGGVGKTLLAKAFAEYANTTNLCCAKFDLDPATRSFARAYGKAGEDIDPISGVVLASPDHQESIFDFIGQLARRWEECDYAVADFGAGVYDRWVSGELFQETNAFVSTLEEYGWRICFVIVITPDQASSETPKKLYMGFGKSPKYAMVQNEYFGKIYDGSSKSCSEFPYFDPPTWCRTNIQQEARECIRDQMEKKGAQTFVFRSLRCNSVRLELDTSRATISDLYLAKSLDVATKMTLTPWLIGVWQLIDSIFKFVGAAAKESK